MRYVGLLRHIVICLVVGILSSTQVLAADVPQSFTLDGQLFSDAAGTTPLADASIGFKVQILDHDGLCVLYEEQQTVNTASSQGYFSVQVGSDLGSPRRTVGDSTNTMASIFQNINAVTGKLLSNGAACSAAATSGNRRFVRIAISPTSMGGGERVLSPNLTLDSVPNAIVAERAESIQGYRSGDLLKVNTAAGATLSQTNLESLFSSVSRFNSLTAIVDGTSSSYVRSTTGGARLPVLTGAPTAPTEGSIWYDTTDDRLKYYDGSAPVSIGTGGGSVSSVGFTAPAELSVAGAPITTSGTIAVTWASQTANRVLAAPNGSAGTPSFRALVAADVPFAVQNAGGTPSLQSGTDAGKGAAGTAGRVWIATDTKLIYRDTGAVWETIGDGGGGGPTGAAGGDLAGTYPNPSVDGLQGVAISAVAPVDGQVLRYTSTGTQWAPANFSVADLRTAGGAAQFATAACTASQTTTWSSLTNTFTCVDIAGLAASTITSGTIDIARLPAAVQYWTAATGGINYAGGNVGIGTTTPTAPLTMYSNNTAAATGQIRIQQDGTGDALAQFMIGATSGYALGVDNSDGDKFKIGSSSSGYPGVDAGTLFTIDKATGFVGVGSDNPGARLQVGDSGASLGSVRLAGNTSGYVQLEPSAAAGSWTMTLPTGAGTSGQVLQTNGSGVTSWTSVPTNGGTFLAADGSVTAPGFAFSNSTNSGMYYSAGPYVHLTVANGNQFRVSTGEVTSFVPLKASNGTTAANTALGFFNDNDTGIFNPAADTMAFSTAGSERVRILANGNVGIGTNNPGTPLQVNGVIQGVDVNAAGGSMQAYRSGIGATPVDGYIAWGTTLATVGTPVQMSPRLRLLGSGWDTGLGTARSFNSSIDLLPITGNPATANLRFGMDPGTGTYSYPMVLTSAGNVGIGSTNPTALLELGTAGSSLGTFRMTGNTSGYVQLQPAAAAGSWTMTLPSGAGASGQVLSTNGSGVTSWTTVPTNGGTFLAANGTAAAPGFAFNSSGNGDNGMFLPASNSIAFSTAGAERMTINSSGQIGVGTSSPSRALDFQLPYTNIRFQSTNAGQPTTIGLEAYDTGSVFRSSNIDFVPVTGTNQSYLEIHNGVSNLMTVRMDGNVGLGTTSPGARLQVGEAGTSLGTFRMTGNTSGYVQLQPAAAAGSWTMTLPTGAGTNGQVLTTNGSGVTSWTTVSGGAATSVSAGDGTAGAPSISFSADTNTGVYRPGNDIVGVSTGGTERLRVAADGQLSVIAAAANAHAMTIRNTQGDGYSGIYFIDHYGGYPGHIGYSNQFASELPETFYMGSINPIPVVFKTNNTEKMRILSAGNVGIGSNNPGALLQLGTAGTSLGTFRMTGNTSGYVQLQPAAAAGSWTMTLPTGAGTNGQVLTTNGSGVTSWTTVGGGAATSVSAGDGTAGAPSISFSADTNTGIYRDAADSLAITSNGNTVATFRDAGGLTVQSNYSGFIYGNDPYAASGSGFYPVDTGFGISNTNGADNRYVVSNMSARNANNDDQYFYTAVISNTAGYSPTVAWGQRTGAATYAERMRLSAGGQLSIGNTSTAHTLNVTGSAGLSTGTAWTNTSDARLKDVHGNYEYGLDEILKLNTVRFNYKKDNALGLDSSVPMTGFVAQEVQKVIPDAVTTRDDGYLELNVDPIHWAVVNAVKKLFANWFKDHQQLQTHERKIASVEEENERLKAENAEIKARLERLEQALLKNK